MNRRRLVVVSLALAGLAAGVLFVSGSPAEAQSPFLGKYRGVVMNVTDPEGLGRIQALVPSVLGAAPTGWALPALPFAGAGHGLVLLPEVGDNVWIEFEGGDPDLPIWTGTWFASAPLPVASPVTTRALVTSQGHVIAIDEAADRIEILHAGGGAIRLTGDEISLSIGGTSLVLSADGIFMNGKRVARTK